MHFTRLKLKNWRNFTRVDLELRQRLFITGPNASGKSNFLDAFRFLRDIAKSGGGLQQAVEERGGLTKLRCLAARRDPNVDIEVELGEGHGDEVTTWRYGIGLKQETRGLRRVLLTHEKVWKNDILILNRPDKDDRSDDLRLTETHLEQITANRDFRPLAEVFQKVLYLHLVPQLLKFPHLANRDAAGEDPFGIKFLDRMMETPEKTRRSRLRKIEKALQIAVPELQELRDVRDEKGIPHLEAVYQHWRPNAGRQREDQFSDGTLRLIGLLWTLLDGDSLLLLEEPELSLHTSIVSKLPELIWRLQRTRKRQVIVSSHSAELFSDKGIAAEEVALLKPHGSEGTEVELASGMENIRLLLDGGMTMADAVLPLTAPATVSQLALFD
ncbi:MAG TPA: AAA family ATPase [Prosthecobacter sp.]|jgi:predicted ATPase|nr:AAA family ATPase [Prosthecobacter sp.]